MSNTYFLTGFPGFIAASLVKQLLQEQRDIHHIYLFVLPSMRKEANQQKQQITLSYPLFANKITIIQGDITEKELQLSPDWKVQLKETVTHVFHLAAIYDLTVAKPLADSVNITGTKHINEWALTLKELQRYTYFSTAYVSGDREGLISEDELEMNQSFKNHYERTKYQAEVLVKQIQHRVPTTIIRPGVVIGHSQTGETSKFDGPYFILNVFEQLKWLPLIPYLGKGQAELSIVPVDYVLQATLYLSHVDIAIGKTYHITNPNRYTIREVYKLFMNEYLGRDPLGTLPLSVVQRLLSFRKIREWLQIEQESLAYSVYNVTYDCTQAQKDLKESGITCPNFKQTVTAIVRYYNHAQKDKKSKQRKND